MWANDAQDKINKLINPALLEFYNKKNLRSLSNEENKELDLIKTKILFALTPFTSIGNEQISHTFSNLESFDTNTIVSAYLNWLKNLKAQLNKELTVEEYKQAKASFYSMVYSSSIENEV